ncbi:malonate decarboxylase acyl carrier protein [Streptomyces sp. NBC_00564]|uniref:malonate decarboxylase acyl carrier protein n=1 Tax=Streptomyces sp. NBC_00564 TaxID=2903663 RepID=UPI002FCD8420|nr:malonate decarboxylase acyl carrier protein [Streptomyces sp. NBC_00564]
MRTLHFTFHATVPPAQRAHVGVVGSGDLEILLQPGDGQGSSVDRAHVTVRTSVEGFDEIWQATLERFFARTPVLGTWELNDAAATPALVSLRLAQAAEASGATTSTGTEGEDAS